MLTESGYQGALLVYVIAALLALALGNLWLLRGRSLGVRALVTLPLAALLLTPAYIQPEADSFAPALIVVGFQWFSQGLAAARHAIDPLALFTLVGLGLGALLALLSWWRSRREKREADPAG